MKKLEFKNKTIICNRESYTAEDFVALCIEKGSATLLAEYLGCARTTINSCIKKYFPELPKGTQPLRTKFLYLMEAKYCTKCSGIKSLEDFHKNKSRKDGMNTYCKSCVSVLDQNRVRDHKKEYDNNKEYYKYKASIRHAERIKRTPSWADHEKIKEVYRNCPNGYHVDHIIPLRGERVSGLHVHNNLQYLSAIENLKKSNHYEVD